MEQREKSMGADATAKAEAVTEVARPARYVAESDAPPARESERSRGAKPKKSAAKKNRLRETRIEKMMSKAELARRANLSVLTIDRVEKGLGCRMDTKRKILEALGMSLADRVRVFGEEE
jgi:DNA-binding XRE family transcriptional regulator